MIAQCGRKLSSCGGALDQAPASTGRHGGAVEGGRPPLLTLRGHCTDEYYCYHCLPPLVRPPRGAQPPTRAEGALHGPSSSSCYTRSSAAHRGCSGDFSLQITSAQFSKSTAPCSRSGGWDAVIDLKRRLEARRLQPGVRSKSAANQRTISRPSAVCRPCSSSPTAHRHVASRSRVGGSAGAWH